MSKIVSTKTKKTSAIFLAVVLVVGTFALLSPSFMTGAEAYPDFGMEKKYKSKYPSYGYDDDYKSKYQDKDKDKKVIVKKVKCNNININLNGLEIGDFPGDTATGLAAQGAEGNEQLGAQAFGNGESSSNKFNFDDNFVFVCINNNNNARQGGGEETDECETCFTRILTEEDLAGIIADFAIEEIDSLQEICNFIDENVGTAEGRTLISETLTTSFSNAEVSFELLNEVLDCLEKVYDVEFPRLT